MPAALFCVSAMVPIPFERMPESVLVLTELTVTRPAPPRVLVMLLAMALPTRFTSVSTPPVPTVTVDVPAASRRLGDPPVPTVRLPPLTVVVPLMLFAAFVSVVVPAPLWVRASVFAPPVSEPARVLLLAELTTTVPVAPSVLVMLFSIGLEPAVRFTISSVPPMPTLIALAAVLIPAELAFPALPICSVPRLTVVPAL